MSTISDYYKYATLATASYVRVGSLAIGSATFAEDFVTAADNQSRGRLPEALGTSVFNPADPIAARWDVLDYYGGDIPGVTEPSGFAATLFERDGEKVLAMRGTEPGEDVFVDLLSADLAQIGIFGLALTQVVAMANYVMRLRGKTTELVPQLRVQATTTQPTSQYYVEAQGQLGSTVYLAFSSTTPVLGLDAIKEDETVKLIGHSLGGHLAVMAARLFPDLFSQDVVVFNSAGYDPTTADLLSLLSRIAPIGTAAVTQLLKGFVAAEIGQAANLLETHANQLTTVALDAINQVLRPSAGFVQGNPSVISLISEDVHPGDDTDIVASAATGNYNYGAPTPIATEGNSHLIEPFMDSLSLHALLSSMNANLTILDTNRLLEAASRRVADSEETILEGLFKTVKGQAIRLTKSDPTGLILGLVISGLGKGDLAARQEYYEHLLQLQEALEQKPALRLFSLAGTDAAGLRNLAIEGGVDASAYRHALKELNPFVVVGDPSIYDALNADGGLNVYADPSSTPRGMTTGYIEDRAAFLYWKVLANVADATSQTDGTAGENWRYTDLAQEYTVHVSGGLPGAPDSTIRRRAVFGGAGADALQGEALADRLYGGLGTDLLTGGAGDDYLEGGAGFDVYQYGARQNQGIPSNDGADNIRDTDGWGVIRYTYAPNGQFGAMESAVVGGVAIKTSETEWQSPDGKFTYTQQLATGALEVSINGDAGGAIRILDFDFAKAQAEGFMGIRLVEVPGLPAPARVIEGDLEPLDVDPNTPGTQTDTDEFGNLLVTPNSASNRADTLFGSDGQNASDPNDSILAGGGDDVIDAKSGDDIVQGGSGRDTIIAGTGNDMVEAGANGADAGDIVEGGDGADRLYADARSNPAGTPAAELAAALAAGEAQSGSGLKGDFLSAGLGNDVVIGAVGDDVLAGGAGSDILIAGAGNDFLLGDSRIHAANLDWDVTRTSTGQYPIPAPLGPIFDFALFDTDVVDWMDDADAGADALYGGAGNDWMDGGADDDFLDAGSGNDVAFGNLGNDVLLGGAGNDVLDGDHASIATSFGGDDYLDGGEGHDWLYGRGGDDILFGGSGNDNIEGNEGNDILIGGPGSDVLRGGAGKDTYVLNRGDGFDALFDTSNTASVAEASVVVLGGDIVRGQVKFRPGSLIIDAGEGDGLWIEGFDPDDPLATPVLSAIHFADGDFMSFEDVLAQGFDIDGTSSDEEIYGTAVTDRILAGDGNDYVEAKAGDDTIDGGIGDDEIRAGEGNDTVTAGDGNDLVLGEGGDDTIDTGAGDDTVEGGDGADVISGGEGQDLLLGGAGNDVLNGDAGDDALDGATGNDTLSGGAGVDSYVIYGGMGTDVITDGEGGEANVLQLGAGLGIENVKTEQVGDSLVVSLRGLNDSVTITDFYTRSQDWVVRDIAGTETALQTVIDLPDPYGADYIGRVWADAKLGATAKVFGQAYAIGWKSLDGDTFEGLNERAFLDYFKQTTVETFSRVDPPNEILAQNTTESVEHTVEGFGGRSSTTFFWNQHSFESGYLESDASFIQGSWIQLPQQQFEEQALLTLKPDRLELNHQLTQQSVAGGVVSYETGTETILASVRYDYEFESYSHFADITYVEPNPTSWPHAEEDVVGNQVFVDMMRLDNRYLSVNEIVAGAGDNTIVAGSSPLIFQLSTLIDGGAGNDTLFGDGGLLYGNSGDDTLSGADAILIGGDGDDAITGQGGSTFVYTATETGVDAISEAANATEAYLDWYYGNLGVEVWQESAEHGGRYRVDVGAGGSAYYDTLEEAQLAGDEITFIEPLVVSAPVVRRNDPAGLAALEAAGVLKRDVVTFGPGLTLGDLDLTIRVFGPTADEHPEEPWYGGGDLSVRWNAGLAGFDITVDDADYGLVGGDLLGNLSSEEGEYEGAWQTHELGVGVELFQFVGGSTYMLEEVLAQATIVKRYGYDFLRGSGFQVIEGQWTGVDFEPGIDLSEVVVERNGSHLVFRLTDFSAEATIPGWYSDPQNVPQWEFRFADGTVFDTDTVTRLGLTQIGTSGFDVLRADPEFASALYGLDGGDFLSGGNGNDLLDGGQGTDFVEGFGGNDIYVYDAGYGEDTVSEAFEDGGSGIDVVRFGPGVTPGSMSADRDEGSLVLTVGGGADTLTVRDWFGEVDGSVESFQFADGTVWDASTIVAMLPASDPATEGDDILWGGFGDDVLDGLGGNDEVAGFAGDDTLYGGAGDDYLDGGSGNDLVFTGDGADYAEAYGPGNDLIDLGADDDYAYMEDQGVIIGGTGDDWMEFSGSGALILYNVGDGSDTLYFEAESFSLSLGGASASDLSLVRIGGDVAISVGQNETITLTGYYRWFGSPPEYPEATLQLFGSAHLYDLGTLLDDYLALEAQDPGLVLQLDGVLPSYEIASSETDALGGAIAWEYANSGSLAALTEAQLRSVLTDPLLGVALQPMTLPSGNSAPVAANAIADQSANEDAGFSFAVPAGTFSDPDAGDELTYTATLEDGSVLPGWLAFDAETQTFSGTPQQADVGAIDVEVTATDGGSLSAEDTFTLTVQNVNDAPVVSAADADLLLNDAVLASALFSVFDEDGQTPTQYEFWDDAAGGGRFEVNGVEQGATTAIAVSAADLANTEYAAGSTPGTERVWARAYDGEAWSAWQSWNMTSALHIPNAAPEATPTATTQTILLDQSVAASSLFSVLDADGDPAAAYQFWDSTAGNGYFAVNGLEQAINTAIVVDAADLANTSFVGGTESGSDQVWVRATDGQTYGAWKSWTMNSWPHATNAAPVADAPDNAVLRNQSALVASLFTVTDADGDAPVQYEFWDGTAGGGYFAVNGEERTNNPIPVAAADLATVTYVGGGDAGVEQVWVRASDGMQWGAWESWSMTTALHIPNAAPEASPTAATQTVLLGQSITASSLFSVLDADGDPAVRYEFFDSTAGNGHFAVNGVEQAINIAIVVDAADLANTEFVASTSSGSDQVWVRATDGQSFGAWVSWTMNSWPHLTNAAPAADAEEATILTGEAVAAASLFSVSDADGDAAVRYEFWDDVAGGGYFRVDGIQQAAATSIAVDAADLANAEYVGGANPGSEQVWVRANDGMAWGAWESWTMNSWPHLTNDAPVVTASNATVLLGQSVDASSLFAVTDADEDVITQYEFWDSTAGSGHFTVGGVEQGVNVAIGVTAAQLADTDFVAAASTGSDSVWVRAHDGMAWSDWKSWSMNSWPHLTNAAPVVSASNAGILRNEALSAAMFFGVADADGDTAVQYEFWDDVNGGGHWSLEGVQQAASQAIPVTAAQLADLDFVGAANSGTEQVWARASDGMGWSAWKNWLMATEGGMLRGGDGPDTLNGEAGPTVLQGGGGNDTLTDTDGDNLFSGGEGDDQMTGGEGDDLFAGGSGNDTINTGGGNNIIAYNAGGGIDTVVAPTGSVNTLSFGGGIGYDDLSLSKDGNDLIVSAGENDQVVLKDWYAGSDSVLNLQIVHDASDEFDAGSADPLYNRKVQTFDFAGMVAEFDDALAQTPGLTSWAVTNALLQFHLSGSDDAAIGGDLAYWYGKNNGFTGISLQAAQQVIGGAGFGSDAQSLQSFNGLQEGYVKLA